MYFETKEWRVGRTTIFARSPTLSRASKSGEPPVSIRNMVCTASPVNMQQTMPAHETRILASGRSSCKNLLRKVLSKFRWKPYKPGVYLTPPDGVDEMATVIADQAIAAFGGDPETVDRPALRTRLSNTNRAHAESAYFTVSPTRPSPHGVDQLTRPARALLPGHHFHGRLAYPQFGPDFRSVALTSPHSSPPHAEDDDPPRGGGSTCSVRTHSPAGDDHGRVNDGTARSTNL